MSDKKKCDFFVNLIDWDFSKQAYLQIILKMEKYFDKYNTGNKTSKLVMGHGGNKGKTSI